MIAGAARMRSLLAFPLRLLLIFASVMFGFATPAAAQIASGPAATTAPAATKDPYGRESPRGLANGLIAALAARDFDRAANYFDLSRVRASQRSDAGSEYARKLQAALDGGGSLLSFAQLSADPAGRLNDQLPKDEERLGTLPGRRHPVPLLAISRTDKDGATAWTIDAESLPAITAAAEVAASGGPDRLRQHLPRFLTDTDVAGAPLSDWLVLLVMAVIYYVAVRLAFAGILFAARRGRAGEDGRAWRVLHAASSPMSLYLALLLFLSTTQSLHVAIVARQLVGRVAGAVAIGALAWFLWRLIDVLTIFASQRMASSERWRARSILIFSRRGLKLVLAAFAVIATLGALGINVTTGIAALGIGGIAVALGAQKTVENIVGSVSVILDEPVRIGDFCRVGDVKGTVEDIGIRSTRIRTNDRTRVTIPNGMFASQQIENYALRDRFFFNPTLNLSPELDADAISRVLAAVHAMLAAASHLQEGARVNFIGWGAGSLDIQVTAWIAVTDANEAADLTETMLLGLMRCVVEAGAQLAFSASDVRLQRTDALKQLRSALGAQEGDSRTRAKSASIMTDETGR